MRYAEFYHLSTGTLCAVHAIPACGSDSVWPFDGRYSLAHCVRQARALLAQSGARHQKGYVGFAICEGSSYIASRTIRALELTADGSKALVDARSEATAACQTPLDVVRLANEITSYQETGQ